MLDIKFIRENPQKVQQGAKSKGIDIDIDHILEIDAKHRELSSSVQKLREDRNIAAREQNIEEGKRIKTELETKEHALKAVEEELKTWLLKVPNPPAADVPEGQDESSNQEIRKVGEIHEFPFPAKTHDELGLSLGLYDSKRAVKIAGSRAFFLKGDLVLLEQAVLNYALNLMIREGFTPFTVPWMVGKDALWGTGYFPWGIEDHYATQDGQVLIGTAEVPLTSYFQDEILNEKDLPLKFVGISPCFRREVGSYGKDTKGFFRVHQFNKVEQVVFTAADEDETREWHEKMLGYAEKILQDIGLSYRVVLMCTGETGAGQRKKYDLEVWFPAERKYRETHSASYFNDFQSRRLNIKYRAKDGTTKYAYTLNNTVIATPRILAAILENYQLENGSVGIPTALQKYMGKSSIKSLQL